MNSLSKAELINIAEGLIKECKNQHIRVDCWSVKHDNIASGIATLDCDIAIDVVNKIPEKLSRAFTFDDVEYDDSLIRLKFIVND